MTTLELKKLESALAARAAELVRALSERNQITIERSADDFDAKLLSAARESSAHNLEQNSLLLRQVEEARNRLREGSFGICTRCEEEISTKRLQAIPWAAYCLSCQQALEEGEGFSPRLERAA